MNLIDIELARGQERDLSRYNDALGRQLYPHPYKSLQCLTDNEEELALLESDYYGILDQVDIWLVALMIMNIRVMMQSFLREGLTAVYCTSGDYVMLGR